MPYIHIYTNIYKFKQQNMLSFGQLKNNLHILKTTLKKMQYFDKNPILSYKQFQQPSLRQYNNQIFLPLLNYILIQYSIDIYMQILDKMPDFKFKDDKAFVQAIIIMSREWFSISGSMLTCQQFLSNKYFQKKVQFVANLAKTILQSAEVLKKNKAKEKQKKQYNKQITSISNKNINQQHEQYQFPITNYQMNNNLDDFQQEEPIVITAPIKFDMTDLNSIQNNKSGFNSNNNNRGKFAINLGSTGKNNKKDDKFKINGQQFYQHQIETALEERHPTPVNATRKPVQQPITISDKQRNKVANKSYQVSEQPEQPQQYYNRFKLDDHYDKIPTPHQFSAKTQIYPQKKPVAKPKHNKQQHEHPLKHHKNFQHEKQQNNLDAQKLDYVNRHEFNEIISLFRVLSQTVNEISLKFVQHQTEVNTKINNLNARILMIESTVRLLKDNL